MISNQVIRKIVEESNIVEIVNEYVPLQKKGNNFWGVCPFHDDTKPSMSVTNVKHMFNCFSCGTKGNVITFVQKFENITFNQAVLKLAKKLNIEVDIETSKKEARKSYLESIMQEAKEFYNFYLLNSEEGNIALEYLKSRNIDLNIIKEFEIGLSPSINDSLYKYLIGKGYLELDLIELGLISDIKGTIKDTFRSRIIFPLNNSLGKTNGFSGRKYLPNDLKNDNLPKYINSNDNELFHKGEILYHLDKSFKSIRQLDKVFIFEGFMDVIAAYKAGVTNSVATMGTALTKTNAENLLSLTKNIVLCFDGDKAGIDAMENGTLVFSKLNTIPQACVLPDNLDPDDFVNKYGKEKLVEYFNKNIFSVYEWVYRLAYKNLIKQDLVSVETFKKKIFDFIKFTSSETIIDYYLKQISNELNVSYDAIRKDFSNNQYTYSSIDNKKQQLIKKADEIIKYKRSTKGVKRAYEMIIMYALNYPETSKKYFDVVGQVFPGKEFINEYSILLLINSIFQEHPDDCTKELLLNHINKEDEYNKYIEQISTSMFKINSVIELNDCLNTIKKYLSQIISDIQIEKAKSGDDEAYKILISYKSDKKNGK